MLNIKDGLNIIGQLYIRLYTLSVKRKLVTR